MSGNSAHVLRSGIVRYAAQNAVSLAELRGCGIFLPIRRRKIASVQHSERLEDVAVGILVQRPTADFLDQFSEDDVVDVAVAELGPWDRDWLFLVRHAIGSALPCWRRPEVLAKS